MKRHVCRSALPLALSKNLAKFLNQVAPRYGYEFLAVENNPELNKHLNLMEVPIKYSNCYFAPLGEELAEQLED